MWDGARAALIHQVNPISKTRCHQLKEGCVKVTGRAIPDFTPQGTCQWMITLISINVYSISILKNLVLSLNATSNLIYLHSSHPDKILSFRNEFVGQWVVKQCLKTLWIKAAQKIHQIPWFSTYLVAFKCMLWIEECSWSWRIFIFNLFSAGNHVTCFLKSRAMNLEFRWLGSQRCRFFDKRQQFFDVPDKPCQIEFLIICLSCLSQPPHGLQNSI